MSVGKTKRFKVFERDNYTCRYCGSTPPEVKLEVDHIIPKSKNGGDDLINLVTSCYDCNRGKRDTILISSEDRDDVKLQVKNKKEIYRQLEELIKWDGEIQALQDARIECLEEYWESIWECNFTARGRASMKIFAKQFPDSKIKEAIDISVKAKGQASDGFKYMCGVLHNWKNGINEKPTWQQQ